MSMSLKKTIWLNYNMAKRSFDVWVSCLVLFPSVVLVSTMALLVVLIDKQNPFFLQKRTVNNQSIFDIYKIRTMKNGIVTQLGSVFRKFSIDEIPQIYNVLKWEMSLVWPRPISLKSYKNKNSMPSNSRAGLTWLLQIQDNHKELDFNKLNVYNRMYDIKKWFWLDIYIILKTIPKVICWKNK